MRVEDALTQVRAIQLQVARTEQYCCYRWVTVAASGVMAVIASIGQAAWIADPAQHPGTFITWWVAVAGVNVAIIGAEMLSRWLRSDSEFARRQTLMAVQQFAPCLLAGGLLTVAVWFACPEFASLLPSVWSIIFSLGIFASWRYLPRHTLFAAWYYLVAGVMCIHWARGDQSLQPWTMLITFGAGQLITSFLLYRHREPIRGVE
jgi:hypothetical protein